MLELSGLRSGYGGVTILKNVDLTVEAEIFAVLGANGAGKSTLMKTIARLLTLESGTLRFLGDDVSQVQPNKLAEMGISIVLQEANIFPDLTVRENLSLGTLVGARSRRARIDEVFDLFPDIAALANQKAGSLSGGEAQMVAFGRALAQEPRLMLLDEPTTGLSPKYVELLLSKVREIHESVGVAILLAEQNAVKALEVADRVLVLSLGAVYLNSPTAQTDLEAIQAGYHI